MARGGRGSCGITHVQDKWRGQPSWWSLGLEDDVLGASYLWIRE